MSRNGVLVALGRWWKKPPASCKAWELYRFALSDIVAWARQPSDLADKCVTEVIRRFRPLMTVLLANGRPLSEAQSIVRDALHRLSSQEELFSVHLWQEMVARDGQGVHHNLGYIFFLVQFIGELPPRERAVLEIAFFAFDEKERERRLAELRLTDHDAADAALRAARCALWKIFAQLGDAEVRRRTRHDELHYWSHDIAHELGIFCGDDHEQ